MTHPFPGAIPVNARTQPRLVVGLALALCAFEWACAPLDNTPQGAGGDTSSVDDPDDTDDFDLPDTEVCDGFDDDQDGTIDEGCACAEGATQSCFQGDPAKLGVGACVAGVQTCETSLDGEFETSVWGDCVGSVGPNTDTCGDGVDSDCDGEDGCDGSGGNGAGGGGAGGGGGDGAGGGPTDCVPSTEVCGNGLDEDCDGADEPCNDIIDVDLFLFGDCITASCPSTHPYPVGCDVAFSPGDNRGCIASVPTSSVVYFQAGDACSKGFIGGTLTCSTVVGAPLSLQNCPINKPIKIYAVDPSGCPEITD